MIQAGDMNLVESIINLEIRVGTLERGLGFIASQNYSIKMPSQSDIERFRKEALEDVKKKYPELGIQ